MRFKELMQAIEEIAKENPEGFTLRITTMELVSTGIAVGHAETQHCYSRAGLYVCIEHALYNYGVIGGWRNQNGEMQYDSVRMFKDLRAAVKWGRKQKQYAIFDIDNGWEIVL